MFKLDAKIMCRFCKKTTLVKSWKCKCGIDWHRCRKHQIVGRRSKNTRVAGVNPGIMEKGTKKKATEKKDISGKTSIIR